MELIYVCSLQHNVNQSEINKCNGGGDEENEIQDPSIYYRVTMTSAWGFSQNCAKKKKLLKICNFHYIFVNMHACVFGELQLKGSSMQNSLYKLFEHNCVLEVCTHIHPIMIKIHQVFFFKSLLKSGCLRALSE